MIQHWFDQNTNWQKWHHAKEIENWKNAHRQIEKQDLTNVTACFAFVGRLGKPIETEKISTLGTHIDEITIVQKTVVFFELGFRSAVLPCQLNQQAELPSLIWCSGSNQYFIFLW